MEGESRVTRSIIDELDSLDIQRDQMEVESMVLLDVSLINFNLMISKENKWKVKVVLFEVSLKNFIFRISKEIT